MSQETNPGFIAMVSTMGNGVLLEAMKKAAYYVVHSNGSHRQTKYYTEGRGFYAFIQGTGLETIVNYFNLSYDADQLKAGFFYCLRQSI